ncbi:MAG: hypothetical protein ACMXYL_03605 [Candidatus Woesearchaeota archaeon]
MRIIGIIMLLIIAIIAVEQTSALGIAPSQRTFDYQPDTLVEGRIRITHDSSEPTRIMLFLQGELDRYFTLSEYTLDFEAGVQQKEIEYRLLVPQGLDPGMHDVRIIVQQTRGQSRGQIDVISAIEATYSVFVPYGEKYVHARIFTPKDSRNAFIIDLENRGSERISNVHVQLDIYSGTRLEGTLSSQSIPLERGAREYITLEYDKPLLAGTYEAEVTITYDGIITRKREPFLIGDAQLILHEITSEHFSLGSISKLVVDIENPTHFPITQARITLEAMQEGRIRATYTTDESFSSRMRRAVPLYIDTTDLVLGDAELRLTALHGTSRETLSRSVVIEQNNIRFSGRAVSEGTEGAGSLIPILVIGLIAVIILNILILTRLKKK